jgi:hypothetical protein
MQRRAFLLSTFFLLGASGPFLAQEPCPALETKVSDPIFKPGQVWSYQTRPDETSSTLTILQVDRSAKLGMIVHVRIDGLQAHNPSGDLVPSVEHMPFTRDAMLLSTTHLIRTATTLPTLEGYDRWRADCGGVYSISVAQAVEVMEKTLNHP